MSGFFAALPPEPEPEPLREQRWRMPPWCGAPRGVVPGIVPVERVVAAGDGVALAVTALRVYPAGLAFDLLVFADDEAHRRGALDLLFDGYPGRAGSGVPDEMLRIGVELPDGRRVSNLDRHLPDPGEPGPRLAPTDSGGSSEQHRLGFWLWPLPDRGTWSIVVEWPVHRIAETWLRLDGTDVAAAAARANVVYSDAHLPLWGEDDGESGGWSAYSGSGA